MYSYGLLLHRQQVLLVHYGNVPDQRYPNTWGFVGGKCHDNELPEQCLIRKCQDQATFTPHNMQFLAEIPEADAHIYLIELSDEEAIDVKAGPDVKDLKFFSHDELRTTEFYQRMKTQYPEYFQLFIDFLG